MPTQEPAGEASARTAPARQAPARKAPARTAPARTETVREVQAPRTPVQGSRPGTPAAAPGADPEWTAQELAEVRAELEASAVELREEVREAEAAAEERERSGAGEAGGDEADVGSKALEREHELSLAHNSRDLLLQVERALARLEAGTYGRCEGCLGAIPKPRLQAFPRATQCVACKQREERR